MSGKLPIDRVREAEDAPRIYERDKRRYSEEQAALRRTAEQPETGTAEFPVSDSGSESDHA